MQSISAGRRPHSTKVTIVKHHATRIRPTHSCIHVNDVRIPKSRNIQPSTAFLRESHLRIVVITKHGSNTSIRSRHLAESVTDLHACSCRRPSQREASSQPRTSVGVKIKVHNSTNCMLIKLRPSCSHAYR